MWRGSLKAFQRLLRISSALGEVGGEIGDKGVREGRVRACRRGVKGMGLEGEEEQEEEEEEEGEEEGGMGWGRDR